MPSPKLVPLVLSEAQRASLVAGAQADHVTVADRVGQGDPGLFAAYDLASGSVVRVAYVVKHRGQPRLGVRQEGLVARSVNLA